MAKLETKPIVFDDLVSKTHEHKYIKEAYNKQRKGQNKRALCLFAITILSTLGFFAIVSEDKSLNNVVFNEPSTVSTTDLAGRKDAYKAFSSNVQISRAIINNNTIILLNEKQKNKHFTNPQEYHIELNTHYRGKTQHPFLIVSFNNSEISEKDFYAYSNQIFQNIKKIDNSSSSSVNDILNIISNNKIPVNNE